MCFNGIGIYYIYTLLITKEIETCTINLYRMFNSYNASSIINNMNEKMSKDDDDV